MTPEQITRDLNQAAHRQAEAFRTGRFAFAASDSKLHRIKAQLPSGEIVYTFPDTKAMLALVLPEIIESGATVLDLVPADSVATIAS